MAVISRAVARIRARPEGGPRRSRSTIPA